MRNISDYNLEKILFNDFNEYNNNDNNNNRLFSD